jgi:hypothetical protein
VVEIQPLLPTLTDGRVDFIVVGGVAAVVQGSARVTMDLDVVYSRRHENIDRLVTALSPLNPCLRGAPPGLSFRWDAETVRRGLNFPLTTSLGDVDLVGEIAGGGGYNALLPHSAHTVVFGVECFCLGLEKLIAVKRAAGRPKDLETIAELEAIWEERRKRGL